MKENQITIKPKNDIYRVCIGIKDTKGHVDAVPIYGPYTDIENAKEKARELTSNGKN